MVKEYARLCLNRLAAIPASPHETAKAFAVGVFIGVVPFVGTVLSIVAAFVFRLNKVATLLGSFMTNPWTAAFLYAASFKVGAWVLSHERPIDWATLTRLRVGWHRELGSVAPSLVVGVAIIGFAASIFSYAVVRALLTPRFVKRGSGS